MNNQLLKITEELKTEGQDHLLKFYNELTAEQQKQLLYDIEHTDLKKLNNAFQQIAEIDLKLWTFLPPSRALWNSFNSWTIKNDSENINDARCILTRLCDVKNDIINEWRLHGLKMIAEEKVGCLIMAGGQGTRLGWDKPKGTYPIGSISGKSLFQILSERVISVSKLAQKECNLPNIPNIPFYIMTADHNHEATVTFFKKRNYFGLKPANVKFFQQTTIPSLSKDGKVLLESKHQLCRNPNGNGGIFGSLLESNILEDMETKNLKGVHVFGVDNALIRVLDPVFIGYVDILEAEVGNNCTFKINPDEKVGMMCYRQLKEDPTKREPCVVEYSELPQDMRIQRCTKKSSSALKFSAGNVCNHYFRVDFIRKIVNEGKLESLCPHVAHKKIPYIDIETGEFIQPSEPNGIKIEYFIFDAFLFANKVAGLEVAREEYFSPVKNSDGEDSPQTCRDMMTELYKTWLKASNVKLIGNGAIEISPLVSYAGENLDGIKECILPVYLD